MLLEKFSRYFKRYELQVGARHHSSTPIKVLSTNQNETTIETLIVSMKKKGEIKAKIRDDIIELVDVARSPAGHLVLFFHREAKMAADPSYRRPVNNGNYAINQYQRRPDEEQALSAHLIISNKKSKLGYECVLEEVPGLSLQVMITLLRQEVLLKSPYSFADPKTKKPITTTATLKAFGLGSETLKKAASRSKLDFITLIKPADTTVADGLPWAIPQVQQMKVQIQRDIEPADFLEGVKVMLGKSSASGWNAARLKINLDNDRKLSVVMSREDLAKDILLVKSDLVKFSSSLENCAAKIVPQVVAESDKLLP